LLALGEIPAGYPAEPEGEIPSGHPTNLGSSRRLRSRTTSGRPRACRFIFNGLTLAACSAAQQRAHHRLGPCEPVRDVL